MKYSREKILRFLTDEAGRPMSFKELTRELGVAKEARAGFKRLLTGLVEEGAVIKIRGGRYGLTARMKLVTGTLGCHPDGFGFVTPEEGGEDVFIGGRRMGGAMHGDTVLVRVEPPKTRGRQAGKFEGRIIRVVKRAHATVVGRFHLDRGFGVVEPTDERILQDIIIPPGEKKGAMDGMMVAAEITRWPTAAASPAGRVVELLGDPEDPDVEAAVILRKYGLPGKFPPHVKAEVKGVPSVVPERDIKGRVDLRTRTVITIDGETARDFDDAVSVERTPGGYRLFVSIADVSRYVTEGTALDAEACSRGTSVYFPDRCIPMLPEELSNGICSLNPGVDRLTLTAEMDFDHRGEVTGRRFYESVIRSSERMTYTDVKSLLEGPDGGLKGRYGPIIKDLRTMKELAELLMARRSDTGSIDFDLPEPQVIIDIEGRIEDIVRSERNIAHRIIEEFMLAANRCVAGEFGSRGLPFLYRVHEEPDAESMADFRDFAAGFGIHFKPGGPKAYQKVLRAVEGRPEERLINTVLLRSMKQAVYSDENVGHFGLAFSEYTHFTSPIRRYPDLVVHRLLKLQLAKKYTKKAQERMSGLLPEIASLSSARERKAMEAEREILDLKKAQFMLDKVGEVYEGIISGVTSFGLFVELKDCFVEGLVHISTLVDDYYVYEEKKHTLMGENTRRTFRLADEITVKLASVDLARRRIDLLLAEEGRPAPAGRVGKGGKGGRGAGGGRAGQGGRGGRGAKSGAPGGAGKGKPKGAARGRARRK